MSMLQVAEYLKGCPRVSDFPGLAQTGKFLYVFIYNYHYNWYEFQTEFPESRICGLAWLPNWAWHMNAEGKANIRRAYMAYPNTPEPTQSYVFPPPTTQLSIPRTPLLGTFGYVLQLPVSEDKHLNLILGPGRIRMAQRLSVAIMQAPRRTVGISAVTYWDPRNTCDARANVVMKAAERDAWLQGFQTLRVAGVPWWYIQKLRRKLMGVATDVEPIFICPLLPRTPPKLISDLGKIDGLVSADEEETRVEKLDEKEKVMEKASQRGAVDPSTTVVMDRSFSLSRRADIGDLDRQTLRGIKSLARRPFESDGISQQAKRSRSLSNLSTEDDGVIQQAKRPRVSSALSSVSGPGSLN